MREILFRGKRLDNGEWVEGDLIASKSISQDRNSELYINGKYVNGKYVDSIVFGEGCFYLIDTSTVGQYTGLIDKSGKRIFENGYMIIDKQTYKVLFDNGEYILKNIFNCDTIQLKNNSNIGVFVDEI